MTNGLGGYACGTVSGANTRRYHGFLMASLAPPVARTLLVSKIDVSAKYRGRRVALSANEYAGGTLSPRGFEYLQSFALLEGVPTWVYAVDDALLQQQIFMAPGTNCSYLRLEVLRAAAPLQVELRPFVVYRDFHSQNSGAKVFDVGADPQACRVGPPDGGKPYRLAATLGSFTLDPAWYWNFWHREEAARGLDAREDLFTPGLFEADLCVGVPLFLHAVLDGDAAPPGTQALLTVQAAAQRAVHAVPPGAPPWIRALSLAAEQFIVRRAAATSIIAGYPWFADWGRDTMVSLPGLATARGRFDITAAVLKTYAGYLDHGMLPNRFPDGGEQPEYNTADATLWMFDALDDYLRTQPDPQLLHELFPALMSIIRAHAAGTRFGIGVDARDGLLRAGEAGTQVTWMDAKQGDRCFTPRVGKPVEINALWLNALDVSAQFAAALGAAADERFCRELLAQGSAGFARFWNAERGCLFDVLDVDGGSGADARVRPNQILALSLPYCALPAAQMRAVVDTVMRELLTSYGLRSLSPREPDYIGRYGGDPWQRDSAYHMGTVWSWLLGPFARAHYRVYRDAGLAKSFLEPIREHVHAACLGTISEIFEGDVPHNARGCFAQAWSIAEILRAWLYLERKNSAPLGHE